MVLVVNSPYDDSKHEDPGHPERPDRTTAALAAVADLHLGDDLVTAPAYVASRADLVRVHHASYLEELGAYCYDGGGNIDQDTYATYELVVDRPEGGGRRPRSDRRAPAPRRRRRASSSPDRPGHHALPDRAMGFCLLNNVAVAAASLAGPGRAGAHRRLGRPPRQRDPGIFWDEPDVLYVSTHQWPLFPAAAFGRGRGPDAARAHRQRPAAARRHGRHRAPGDRRDRRSRHRGVRPNVGPRLGRLRRAPRRPHGRPAAHERRLRPTSRAPSAASRRDRGALALFLEGGYDLAALHASVEATLSALLEIPYDAEESSSGGPGAEQVERAEKSRHLAIEAMLANPEGDETS